MSSTFPPLSELLPQAGPMRLLDRVLAHDARGTRCAVDPERSFLFREDSGAVPVWVALEYMAQCACVDGGLRARSRRGAPPVAVLAGSRRLVFARDAFARDALLEVSASPVGMSGRGVAFDCRVHEAGHPDAVLAEGRLLVAILERDRARPGDHGRIPS